MIALWMLAATLTAAALGLAAVAAERVARMWRRPARHAWTLALLGAVLGPAVAALLPAPAVPAPIAPAVEPGREPAGVVRLATIVVRADALLPRVAERLAPLDRPLATAWLGLSALAFALVARGALGLARARRGWRRHVVDGTPVLLAADAGPAVVGLRRPAIVLPEWALSLDASLRTLVMRHEAEHVRARDPMLLALGAVAATLMPWNAAVWWQLRRLRAALEIDCDARVLAAHRDVTRYGLLLLAVAQRRATASPWRALVGAPALAESTSDLSRRIDAMRMPPARRRTLRTALGGAVAALATAGAFAACSAADDVAGAERRATRDSASPPGMRTLGAVVVVAPTDSVPAMRPAGDGTMRPGKAAASRAPLRLAPQVANGPYMEFQVEKPVTPAPGNRSPRYPQLLRDAGVEGTVLVQFVVDTTGAADMRSFRVLRADHDLFVQAVKGSLAEMRFLPAEVGGRKVRQLVQTPFQFALSR